MLQPSTDSGNLRQQIYSGRRNQNFCFSQIIWAIILISLSANSISSSPRRASRRNRASQERISVPLLTTASPACSEMTRCCRQAPSYWAWVLVGSHFSMTISGFFRCREIVRAVLTSPCDAVSHQFASDASFDFDSENPASMTKVGQCSDLPGGRVRGANSWSAFFIREVVSVRRSSPVQR